MEPSGSVANVVGKWPYLVFSRNSSLVPASFSFLAFCSASFSRFTCRLMLKTISYFIANPNKAKVCGRG